MPLILLTGVDKHVFAIDPDAIAIVNRTSSSGGLVTQLVTKVILPTGPATLPILESPEMVADLVNAAQEAHVARKDHLAGAVVAAATKFPQKDR